MMHHPTLDKLKQLKLTGMLRALQDQEGIHGVNDPVLVYVGGGGGKTAEGSQAGGMLEDERGIVGGDARNLVGLAWGEGIGSGKRARRGKGPVGGAQGADDAISAKGLADARHAAVVLPEAYDARDVIDRGDREAAIIGGDEDGAVVEREAGNVERAVGAGGAKDLEVQERQAAVAADGAGGTGHGQA